MKKTTPNDRLYQLLVGRLRRHAVKDLPTRRIFIALVAGTGIIVALAVAGIDLFLDGLYLSASACLVTSLITLLSMISCYQFKAEAQLSYLICLIYSGICLFAIVIGGVGNSGLFWSFMVPMLVYSLLGISAGTMYLTIHALISLTLLYSDPITEWAANYPDETKLRFVVTLFVITMISFFKEFSRKLSIDELKRSSYRLSQQARTDELTKLLNRRAMREKLKYEMNRADRANSSLSLILIDIDFFKNVNDHYGHDIGDEALKAVAQTIKNTLRKPDFVARWGGEEFLILLPMTDEIGAFVMAERTRKAIEALAINSPQGKVSVTISCGLAAKIDHTPLDEMIKMADINLYRAKERGRNQTYPAYEVNNDCDDQ